MSAAAPPRVRAYVPSTVGALAGLVEVGLLRTGGLGFAVTDAVRADDPDADVDEWEFRAFLDAAAASLALLSDAASGPDPVLRRVVVSVDVDAATVDPARSAGPSAVALPGEVGRGQVASVHVDGVEAAQQVGRALEGGPTGVLDDLALEWFDVSELSALLD